MRDQLYQASRQRFGLCWGFAYRFEVQQFVAVRAPSVGQRSVTDVRPDCDGGEVFHDVAFQVGLGWIGQEMKQRPALPLSRSGKNGSG